ncbi:MAG: ABC transporter permease [Deltaproteobacteria bacterium CG11_big_fil_rev_8_21_14_0_20_47_16]|nr:MAG: ABC transporter permease [Deltaproteobacteria bacterium CG11_big_fil_rev_8_21_14_0_20_47_16]
MSEGVRLRGIFPIWWRSFYMFAKYWQQGFIPNLFYPIIYLLGMGAGVGHYITTIDGIGYSMFIAPGLMAVSAMNGASFETTYNFFVKLIYDKLYEQVIATPVNECEIVWGEILWAVTRATTYGLIFLIVMVFFGLVPSWWALGTIAVLPLIGYFFAGMGLAFGMNIKTIDMFSYYFNLVLIPLFVFSDIFFSIRECFGEWGVRIANLTPMYHAVQLCRGFVLGKLHWGMFWSATYLLVLGILLHWIGYRSFLRRLHQAAK